MRDAASALKSFPGPVKAVRPVRGPQRVQEQRPVRGLLASQPTRLDPRHGQNLSASLNLDGQDLAQAANAPERQRGQAPQQARRVQGHRPDRAHRTGLDHPPGRGHRNGRDALNRRAADPAVPDAAATPSNWLENQYAATAAAPPVANAPDHPDPVAQPDLVFPAGCASRLPPASSCSCRSRWDVPRHHHHGVLMHPPSLVRPGRPHHRSPAPQPPRHPVVPGSGQVRQADNVGRDVPIGMTAPNLKHFGAALLRSSARRFTSLAKTTMR